MLGWFSNTKSVCFWRLWGICGASLASPWKASLSSLTQSWLTAWEPTLRGDSSLLFPPWRPELWGPLPPPTLEARSTHHNPPRTNSLRPRAPLLSFTLRLRVHKFQVSFELCFVFQLHAPFSASKKEWKLTSMSFLPYQTENVKELGRDRTLVKLVRFCLTRYL